MNVTVLVGAPPLLPATVAVKVTAWPAELGLSEEVIVVVDDPAAAALTPISDAKKKARSTGGKLRPQPDAIARHVAFHALIGAKRPFPMRNMTWGKLA